MHVECNNTVVEIEVVILQLIMCSEDWWMRLWEKKIIQFKLLFLVIFYYPYLLKKGTWRWLNFRFRYVIFGFTWVWTIYVIDYVFLLNVNIVTSVEAHCNISIYSARQFILTILILSPSSMFSVLRNKDWQKKIELNHDFPKTFCSKALEKASKNQAIIDAIGEPIEKGPWYSASLAVAHKRHSVSCTFPVSGPQGSGIFQLKAVHNGGLYSTSTQCLYFQFSFVPSSISFMYIFCSHIQNCNLCKHLELSEMYLSTFFVLVRKSW